MSSEQLETRNVFIDTSIFVSKNYSFGSSIFQAIISLSKRKQIFLKLPDITVREIQANIEKEVKSLEKKIEKFRKDLRVLRNVEECPLSAIFNPFDLDQIKTEILSQLDSFIIETDAEILPSLKVDPSVIFDKYFNKKPPFGAGKKKAEFPDAFVLSAIEKWCANNKCSVYVISNDEDMRFSCDESNCLLHIQKIEHFLELINKNDEKLAEIIHQRFSAKREEIVKRLSEEITDLWIDLADQEGEAEITEVFSVDWEDESIIEISDRTVKMTFDAEFSFSAQISYDDYETAIYDSEDKVAYPWQRIEDEVERTEKLPVEIQFEFSEKDPDHFVLHHIMINEHEPFYIYVDEDAEAFYK